MMTVGLNLLTAALEVGSDHLALYPSILSIVQDTLCRNLISVSHNQMLRSSSCIHYFSYLFLKMLNSNRLNIFAASLRVSFLLFESLRTHLKCQFEVKIIVDTLKYDVESMKHMFSSF